MNKEFLNRLRAGAERLLRRAEELSSWGVAKYQGFSKREKGVFAVASAMALIVLVDAGAVQPMMSAFKSLERKIAEQKHSLALVEKSLAQKNQIEGAYRQASEQIDIKETKPETVRATMLTDIDQMGSRHQIYLSEVRPQVSNQKKGFTQYNVRVQADGDMKSITGFLADLIRTRKLYYLDSLRISQHPEDVTKVRLYATVSRLVFDEF